MEKLLCNKIDNCDKIKILQDHDMLDFQFADAVTSMCSKCSEYNIRINQYEPVYGEEEAKATYNYLKNGGWCSEFGKTKELTEIIRQYTRAKHCLIVNNGTAALQIAYMALGNGTVICPDYTMPATAYAASLAGLGIELTDINRNNYNLNIMAAYEATDKHKASIVAPVCINGRGTYNLVDIECFHKFNTWIVEDAAQGTGSWHLGKHMGTFGDIGMLSLNVFKLISTGQGGVLLTDNENLYTKMKKIKDFGRLGSRGSEYETLGMNAKFNDLLAVIGIEQFKKLEQKKETKKNLWKWYTERLKKIEQVKFPKTDLKDCAPWYIDPLVERRDELIAFLGQHEIEAQPFYPPLHRLKYYQYLGYMDKDFPDTSYVSDHGIWLPSGLNLTENMVDRVCSKVKEFYTK